MASLMGKPQVLWIGRPQYWLRLEGQGRVNSTQITANPGMMHHNSSRRKWYGNKVPPCGCWYWSLKLRTLIGDSFGSVLIGVADKMDMGGGEVRVEVVYIVDVGSCCWMFAQPPSMSPGSLYSWTWRENTMVVMSHSGASDWVAWDVRTHLLGDVKTFQCLVIRCLVCGRCSVEHWFNMSCNYIMPTSLGLSTFLFPRLLISDLPIFSLINQLPWNCCKLLSWATSLSSLRWYLCALLKYLLA